MLPKSWQSEQKDEGWIWGSSKQTMRVEVCLLFLRSSREPVHFSRMHNYDFYSYCQSAFQKAYNIPTSCTESSLLCWFNFQNLLDWTWLLLAPSLEPLLLSKIASHQFSGSVTRTIPDTMEISFIRERRYNTYYLP